MTDTFRLSTDLDNKRFAALLSAVCKQKFGHRGGDEASATRAIRKAASASEQSEEEVTAFIEDIGKFVEHAGRLGWGATEVANAIAGDNVKIDEKHAKVFIQFWKVEVGSIKRSLAARVTFNKKLTKFNWRIDVKGGNAEEGGGNACALFEMNVANRVSFAY